MKTTRTNFGNNSHFVKKQKNKSSKNWIRIQRKTRSLTIRPQVARFRLTIAKLEILVYRSMKQQFLAVTAK